MAKFGGSAKNSDILQRVSAYARRLVAESIHTASSKMAPLTIYCQKVATSIMLMPLSRADIINAPITAPATLPMPPRQAGAADDAGGDGVQFGDIARRRRPRAEP